VSRPSESTTPENGKTQRHDEIVMLARWRRIRRRAARPHGALHRLKLSLQHLPVAHAGDAQRIAAHLGGDRLDEFGLREGPSLDGAPHAADRDQPSASAGRRATGHRLWRRSATGELRHSSDGPTVRRSLRARNPRVIRARVILSHPRSVFYRIQQIFPQNLRSPWAAALATGTFRVMLLSSKEMWMTSSGAPATSSVTIRSMIPNP
jgi:hypothetical protein